MVGLRDLFEQRECFTLVCAANNFDAENVAQLVGLYYEAGCRSFDVSAKQDVLLAARKAAPQDAYFKVSVASEGDPHCPPVDFTQVIAPLVDIGIDCIELHASTTQDIMPRWNWLRKNFDGPLSLCISRSKLSDAMMFERVRACKPDIIQADGIAMSGGIDDYAATLQAIATAQMLERFVKPAGGAYMILSGGTNTKTSELAHLCGVKAHGVAVGGFAREISEAEQAKYLIAENLKWLKY